MNEFEQNQTPAQEQQVYTQTVNVAPIAQPVYQVNAAPVVERKPFVTSLVEKIVCILIWPACYVYSCMFWEGQKTQSILFGVFTLLFLIMGEVLYWERKRTFESWAFMIMTIMGGVSATFRFSAVWEPYQIGFFTHLFAVYWILCRSGRLAEGKTSHMFIWDGITGFCIMPFKNWPLDIRTFISIFKAKDKEGKSKKTGLIVLAAVLVGFILLLVAIGFLRNADDTFDDMIWYVEDLLRIDWSFIPKIILTIHIVCYLYGLMGGCKRESFEQVSHRGDNIKKFIGKLNKVPGAVWASFIGIFSVFYIIFFVMQGNYLFDAFVMKLPMEFTYSQYARKGFSDMLGIMVVNFILLWLSTRTSSNALKVVKALSAVLNLESMLFALIAFLKIAMYIDAYGYTPLRLQSIWGTSVLFFACVCAMISMLAGKKTSRVWFIVSAASLAIICVYPWISIAA